MSEYDEAPRELFPWGRMAKLLQGSELPEADLEGEIEAGIQALKDCLNELETCSKAAGTRHRPSRREIMEEVLVYAVRLSGLVRRQERAAGMQRSA